MTTASIDETRFPVMGSKGHVMVLGGPRGAAASAERHLRHLEQLWTRFVPTSELNSINRCSGTAVEVSPETRDLVARMVLGWERTGGRFDPTIAKAMAMIGYDRPFDDGLDRDGALRAMPGDGCAGIEVDTRAGTVSVPVGVRLDPGGLGKGLAADMVADALIESGARGALVNVGGDLKVVGEGPDQGAWRIDVAEPVVAEGAILGVLVPGGTGVATSTPLRRAWRLGDADVHHIIDPVTGLPCARIARLVSVVAAEAWWAEVCTKQIAGLEPKSAEGVLFEAAAVIVDPFGTTHLLSGMEKYAI